MNSLNVVFLTTSYFSQKLFGQLFPQATVPRNAMPVGKHRAGVEYLRKFNCRTVPGAFEQEPLIRVEALFESIVMA